ncbi:hypothetical protein BC629DRAFT_1593838 [Irpex lacteus]|nr:hypothetical protein BC629DRAFT_1593838 [Irpex lacteus]
MSSHSSIVMMTPAQLHSRVKAHASDNQRDEATTQKLQSNPLPQRTNNTSRFFEHEFHDQWFAEINPTSESFRPL